MLMKEKKLYEKGSILMDAPKHNNNDERAELAQDRVSWRAMKLGIGPNEQFLTPAGRAQATEPKAVGSAPPPPSGATQPTETE